MCNLGREKKAREYSNKNGRQADKNSAVKENKKILLGNRLKYGENQDRVEIRKKENYLNNLSLLVPFKTT